MNQPTTIKLLLVGASGLVGRHVLDLALSDPRVGVVYAPMRKALAEHPKLIAPLPLLTIWEAAITQAPRVHVVTSNSMTRPG